MSQASARSTFLERLILVVNLIVIAVAGVALFRPGGAITARWEQWRARLAGAHAVQANWNTLIDTRSRLGSRSDKGAVIVEFGDYECPYCRAGESAVTALLAAHPDVTLVFRHFPLSSIHQMAAAAARASICAEDAGQFTAMHEKLFTSTEWQHDPDWQALANTVGVADPSAFLECLEAPGTTERLESDMRLGEEIGVHGVPTFVGVGGRHEGVPDAQTLAKLIDAR